MEAALNTVIGLLGGLALSTGWWYWLAHVVAPRLEFGKGISKLQATSGEAVYRVKISNTSRRGVIDATVYASIRFPGVSPYTRPIEGTVPTIRLSLNNHHVLRIGPRVATFVTFRVADALTSAEAVRLLHTLYPVQAQRDGLTLEDLLRRSEGAEVRISVLCFDEWSSSRKHFRSQPYRTGDVRNGVFRGLELVVDQCN